MKVFVWFGTIGCLLCVLSGCSNAKDYSSINTVEYNFSEDEIVQTAVLCPEKDYRFSLQLDDKDSPLSVTSVYEQDGERKIINIVAPFQNTIDLLAGTTDQITFVISPIPETESTLRIETLTR